MPMSWMTLPLRVKMFTGFLPMWCGIASDDQARIMVDHHLRNPVEFDCQWGPPTLARNEKMYEPEANSANPSNWLGPVWILSSYFICAGLKRYGFHADAALLATKTERLLEKDLRETGSIHECYHAETGVPNFNTDFLSWNVLGLSMR
jgi:putative isomerase